MNETQINTVIRGKHFTCRWVTIGVFLRSVLAPIMFFINDLGSNISPGSYLIWFPENILKDNRRLLPVPPEEHREHIHVELYLHNEIQHHIVDGPRLTRKCGGRRPRVCHPWTWGRSQCMILYMSLFLSLFPLFLNSFHLCFSSSSTLLPSSFPFSSLT